jgi:uncharacterized protein YjbI with pentapeptide repeats
MLHRPNKTAGAKRGLIETSAYDALLPYVAGPDEPPRYALHFGTVEKIGVNPRSQWHTPLAVCAFPLTEEIFEQFLKIDLPFAQKEARYLYLLEIRPEARVFYSTKRFFDQGVGPEYVGTARESGGFFYSTRPQNYEHIPKYVSAKHETVARAARWGRKLWKMGIDVWVDADREGILHSNEPSQVMFFSPLSYSVVLSMDNPKNKQETKYGRDWRKRKDMRGTDLRRADLRRADLTGVDLSGADLTYSLLSGVSLKDVKYDASTKWPDSVRDVLRVWRGDTDLYQADLSEANLIGADLRDVDLRRAKLYGVKYDASTKWPDSVRDVLRVWRGDTDLYRADLREANLTGAKMNRKSLVEANLIGADLRGAELMYADLEGANLEGADLTGAFLTLAYLKDVKHNDDTLWSGVGDKDVLRVWEGDKSLAGTNLSGANLRGADLTGADLTGADLESANLTEAILNEAQLSSNLTYATLIGAKLIGANLSGANLNNAELAGADLTDAKLTGAWLKDTKYDASTVWPDSVRDVLRVWAPHRNFDKTPYKDLTGANLKGAFLWTAKLHKADLTGADLRDAYLQRADLVDALLIDADLRGADLTRADLYEAELEGITYDENTKWPADFTPPPSTPRPNRR